jgi:hypothetical protein
MSSSNDLLFYDIEVFKYDSLVVFKNIEKRIVRIFHNNYAKLAEFIEGKTLCGFNNYHYDDKILTYMLELKPQFLIKDLNDKIIRGENVKFINKPPFRSLDTNQQIDVSRPSLKKIEGNMGKKILESSVSFDIDRPLTEPEFEEVLDYCAYDVDTTIDIYKLREGSYFQPKQSLIEMLGKPQAEKWNTTTISANLLLEKPLVKWESVRIPPEMWALVPEEVKEMWLAAARYIAAAPEKKTATIEEFGNEIQFGFGGLHGAHKKIKRAKKVKLLDVKSMYPNIILILGALGAAGAKYKEILDKRLAIKHVDKILSEALKLILNSVYGNLGNKHNLLYNPMALLSVCVYGQIALFELCNRLAPYAEIININTDGVAFIPHDDAYKKAADAWEKDFLGLELEEKNFDLFIQKDVNNYIAVKNGVPVECKGGDVNRYEKDAFFKNNNARILDIALVEHLVHGKDILTTLLSNLDKPHLFQYILKAGNTYKGVFDEKGNEYNKVNRVFASKKEGFCLYKRRHDNGLVRFADAPNAMYLWNNETSELDNFENIVDINHYYQLVLKRLERWS